MSQTSVDDTTLRPDIAVDNCAENVVAEPDGGVVVRGSGAENVTVEDDDAGDHENGELGQRSEGPVTFAEEFSLQEEEQLVDVSWLEPEYWDASRMARLSAASAAALNRLRAYKPPPFPLWSQLPRSRRAAVLLLLYAGRRGELRVVVTMRSASLRSFSGHAALPGGKADSLSETPYEIARREAWEEIGLPLDEEEEDEDGKARKTTSGGRRLRGVKGFSIEHLCDLPHHLARTDLVVRPCVAFLHVDGKPDDESAADGNGEGSNKRDASSNRTSTMMPRLDAREVAAVFSAPFHNFLRIDDEQDEAPGALSTSRAAAEGDNATSNGSGTGPEQQQRQLQEAPLPPGPWYEGYWMTATGTPWRVHFFHVPVNTQRVAKPKASNQSTGGNEGTVSRTDTETETVIEPGRYKIWGMTAHVLVDAARIAYDEQPEMECNPHLGDEELILKAAAEGRLATETGSSAATVAVGGKGTSGKKKRPAGAPGEGTGSPGSKHSRTKI